MDADNRTRYHGRAKRGRLSRAELDEEDLRDINYAVDELRKAERGLRIARAPDLGDAPRSERVEARNAALAHAAFAARLAHDVCERNGYRVPAVADE